MSKKIIFWFLLTLALLAITQISHPVLIQLPSALIDDFRKKIG